jgi:RNA-directed DNA polymerase
MDKRLATVAAKYDCIVTRFADDIVFSSCRFNWIKANQLKKGVPAILGAFGFQINWGKTRIVPPGERRVVTGLLVDQESPKLRREFRDALRMHLFFAQKRGLYEHSSHRGFTSIFEFRDYLKGLISYAQAVTPLFGKMCEEKFDKLPWPLIEHKYPRINSTQDSEPQLFPMVSP